MKKLSYILFAFLIGCQVMEEEKPIGTVSLTGLEVMSFSHPEINARQNARSGWQHIFPERITLSFQQMESGEETYVDLDPNNFEQPYLVQLVQGQYSFSAKVEGGLMEDYLPFEINGTFVVENGSQKLLLEGFTNYALITVDAETAEEVRLIASGEEKLLPLAPQPTVFYQYLKENEDYTLEVRDKNSEDQYTETLSVVERTHYHFTLEYAVPGNANVVELLMREFDFDYYFGTVEVPFNSIIRDIEGNVYKVVKIGNQTWMAENLRTSKYCNGDDIKMQEEKLRFSWEDHLEPAYFHINYDLSMDVPYGKLYNNLVVLDERNICPCDWEVPTVGDWEILRDYLGGPEAASNKMRNPNPIFWAPPMNENATNESGFNALGTGFFIQEFGDDLYYGNFFNIQEGATWWTSDMAEPTPVNSNPLNFVAIGNAHTPFYFRDFFRIANSRSREVYAYKSIRCIKKN
ncbi:fibrobacter succinogenes major paralogous domain-containing protein [Litoribacter populi]|uniref:fibrobacter succinogenes major paralogous domain-containing protein n=1 Tax=Litoribacter populi TaxID=2598460 RepID=UPI00163D5105|nr:fibrobacter succinogenes major paralogous domain-containing protein [Litoribacter populi]